MDDDENPKIKKKNLKKNFERTLAIIKPEAMEQKNEIIGNIKKAGFLILQVVHFNIKHSSRTHMS